MKLQDLFEAKKNLLPIDAIAMALFKKKAGIVKDPKRDKEKDYLGVTNSASSIKTEAGKILHLSFDNSTDSGEFEIDSFTPLKIERGTDLDKAIKKLFSKYEISSKKKLGYILKGDVSYLREIHLGKKLDSNTVTFVHALIKTIKAAMSGEEIVDDEEVEDPEAKEPVKKSEKKEPETEKKEKAEKPQPEKKSEKKEE